MKPKFELSNEQKDEMVQMIQAYFIEEQNEEIGNLKAMLILDFIMEKLAPVFYNQGVEDSHRYMAQKLDDIFEIQK
ncbi:DUF2164 domain-containing protein [Ornithinibacillus salinisoli]|uniref:DUF2164 domain-containing protein n=1 Tax=Ornithinibacillus salinisoli TaxID=1848459 RepID=A0ABW4VZ19_9BACI